jgi:drug/metabolite transporter (DMT)-like permease
VAIVSIAVIGKNSSKTKLLSTAHTPHDLPAFVNACHASFYRTVCRFITGAPDMISQAPTATANQAVISRGLALMAVAMLVIPSMDILSKLLSKDINGIQVAQWRFGFQAVLILPALLWLKGTRALLPNRIGMNIARAILMAFAVTCFFTALRWMPVPDAISVFFVEPLLLTILSAVFLKEHVGWRRRIAVLVGFIGALIVIQPSYEVFGPVSLLPMATATLFAVYLLLTKKLAASEDPLTMQFFSGVVGFIVLTLVALTGSAAGISIVEIVMPNQHQWGLLFGVGIIATVCHLMIVHAFKRAPASVLAPFQYLEIVSATILSYLVFSQVPDATKWLGIAIIIGSGLYVWWRERQVG